MADNQIIEAEVLETSIPNQAQSKKPFYKRAKFIFSVIFLILIIAVIIWLINVFSTYSKAKVYKEAYDVVQEQIKFCDNPKAEEGQDINIPVHYCDQFKLRFKVVERENTR